MPADELTEWLTARLGQQARLMSGRIQMAKAQLDDADARSSNAPEDASIRAEVSAARDRHKVAVKALDSNISRMEELDMDTAQYQQVLIASTGEITTDIFDRNVASQLLSRWFGGMGDAIVENGPSFFFKLFLFSIVVVFFWTLSRFVRKVTQRALDVRDLGFSQLLKRMIVSGSSAGVLVMGLLIATSQLGVEVGPMLAGLGIAGFVIGFALQDSLANFAAGIMILAYRPFDVGDLIDCAGGVFGTVSAMNLVSTTVLTIDNRTRVVPNGKIWGDVITNVTAQKQRRVDLVVGISYDDNIPKAEGVIRGILAEHPKVLKEPEAVVKVHELGDSSVNLVVRPWVLRDDYWDVHWDVTREIKLRFDREGISIPYPQQDVHFKVDAPAPTAAAAMEISETESTSQSSPESDD
jgi:small conductance mechanosensitive channel